MWVIGYAHAVRSCVPEERWCLAVRQHRGAWRAHAAVLGACAGCGTAECVSCAYAWTGRLSTDTDSNQTRQRVPAILLLPGLQL